MRKRMTIMLVSVFVLFVLVFIVHEFRNIMIGRFIHKFQQQAQVISTTKVVSETWHPELTAVGTLAAVNGVDVSSEVNGMVTGIHFKSGQMVQQGDSLVQLDDATDQQTLKTNQAQLHLDQVNYQRQAQLVKTNSTPQSSVDSAKAELDQSTAAVASAQVSIDKKNIRAPFSGKVGIRQVDLGAYLSPGEPIVSLQAMNPLFVDFALPEQNLHSVHVGQKVRINIDSFPGKDFWGKVEAIDSIVDVNTRSINVRAAIPNNDMQLYPGIFADVAVILPEQEQVLTIPQTAVAYSLHGDSAYVVEEDGKNKDGSPILRAKQRFVTLGDRRGDFVAVTKGLKLGEQVVSSGQLKLQPDMLVEVNNSVKLN